jgi:hypothetical protein
MCVYIYVCIYMDIYIYTYIGGFTDELVGKRERGGVPHDKVCV